VQKKMALVFTGDEFADDGKAIAAALQQHNLKASFFFTGRFYRNPAFKSIIKHLQQQGHYLGAHSDEHLLYNDWTVRDSLLVSRQEFLEDLHNNYNELQKLGIGKKEAPYFLPPYEWYNDTIAAWTAAAGLQLINYTPGTLSHADYTTPDARNYRSSETIYNSIINFEKESQHHLNGAILLLHIGTDAKRTDKFYHLLPQLLTYLKNRKYEVVRIDELLQGSTEY
jgi:peptidoglycan/xylan/chitin deacetylase (PgdA/CDA1 family)